MPKGLHYTEEEYQALERRMQRANGVAAQWPTTREPMSEARLQKQVLAIAKRLGWLCYHPYNSQKSTPGYPDLTLCKPGVLGSKGRLLFAELKREGEAPTIPQQQWLQALAASVPGIEIYLWKPADLEEIARVLR